MPLRTDLRYGSRLRPGDGQYHAANSTGPAQTSWRHGGAMRATPQRWREAMPTKTPEKKASGGKANALQKPLQPSEELAAVARAHCPGARW